MEKVNDMSENYIIQENTLNFEDYCSLRESVEWLNFDEEQMKRGLANSLLTISVTEAGKTVGMGRLIGDGGMYYSIVDVVVRPEYQGKGIGSRILDLILEHVSRQTPQGGRSSVQLKFVASVQTATCIFTAASLLDQLCRVATTIAR